MRSEAELARPLLALPWVLRIAIGGGTAAGGEAAARALVAEGADGLISFGLAAGLVDDAPPGTLVCPTAVHVDGKRLETDPILRGLIAPAGMRAANLLHSETIVADSAAKRVLARESGCAALDMESGGVGRAATEAGVGFAVLRAVCDPVARTLPRAAIVALDPEGGIALGRVIYEVLRAPGSIGAMLALGRDAGAARRALRDHLATLSPTT